MPDTIWGSIAQSGIAILILSIICWQLWLLFKKQQDKQREDIEELRELVNQLQDDKVTLQKEFREKMLEQQKNMIETLNHNSEVISKVNAFMEKYLAKDN